MATDQKVEDVRKIPVEQFRPKPESMQEPDGFSTKVTALKRLGISMEEGQWSSSGPDEPHGHAFMWMACEESATSKGRFDVLTLEQWPRPTTPPRLAPARPAPALSAEKLSAGLLDVTLPIPQTGQLPFAGGQQGLTRVSPTEAGG
ncbi:hypothetical protein SKAU_G00040370 [Synaphobranchus kaupii]|uniref:Uncharacterized protein n=1 Tax=Synaphobranchus kaupii TaxID=118154 RepID=A0A9Q1J8S9_SYNKA|nr:hypothetical protein SKAU_G00040370 [Synaphobranchus kaupii]